MLTFVIHFSLNILKSKSVLTCFPKVFFVAFLSLQSDLSFLYLFKSNVCIKNCALSVWYCQLIVVFLFRCACLNSRSFATMWRCYWRRWMTWRRRAFSKFKHDVLYRVVNKTGFCVTNKKKLVYHWCPLTLFQKSHHLVQFLPMYKSN